ncbi:MAG: VOC family protein [Nocardioidaceae bacterium]
MATLLQVTFDCADPGAQAEFWAAAIGYQVQPPPPPFESWPAALQAWGIPESEWNSRSAVVDPAGVGPRFFFQQVPEGKTAKNRMHLDLHVAPGKTGDERRTICQAEAARLTGLGATVLREVPAEPPNEFFVVMQDPEGNEFCVD